MKVKTKMWLGIVIVIVVLSLLVYEYWTNWRFDRIRITGVTANLCLNRYRLYYYKAEREKRWIELNFGTGSVQYVYVYFLPGQRDRLLEKLKDDIISGLDTLIEEHSDLYYKYEIHDDFKRASIYKTLEFSEGNSLNNPLHTEVGGLLSDQFSLYNAVRAGHNTGFSEPIILEIEPGG